MTFFREILGIGGVVRRLFPEDEALLEFEKTEEHAEIQSMLARLRQKSDNRGETPEPTRVITVRLPKSLHEALQAEAHLHQTSMNKLCISKLLQVIDDEFAGQAREQSSEDPLQCSSPSAQPADRTTEKGRRGPVSRVLSPTPGDTGSRAMAIYLGRRLLGASSGLPECR